jgi:hypothetical protein
MDSIAVANLVLAIIGKAADLANTIITTSTTDSAAAITALTQADAALSTAIAGLRPALAKNDAQIDAGENKPIG